jgi:two-component system nitrate/nitrite response regulator NarL
MAPADCSQPTYQAPPPIKPAGSVLLISRARLLRDMIGRILTDAGFVILAAESYGDNSPLGPPLSDAAWQAGFVIFVSEGDEISDGTLSRLRNAAAGKIVLLLPENRIERITAEILVAADGILSDEVSADALVQALGVIQSGERVIPRHLAQVILARAASARSGEPAKAPVPDATLSPREEEIIRRLVLGEANKVIAHVLNISEATVKVHLKAILRKISAQNRTQAALWAVNNGFHQSPGLKAPPADNVK